LFLHYCTVCICVAALLVRIKIHIMLVSGHSWRSGAESCIGFGLVISEWSVVKLSTKMWSVVISQWSLVVSGTSECKNGGVW